ncbi:MAG: SGNH/GDSL hydrolase family protein [Pirellula sp.]
MKNASPQFVGHILFPHPVRLAIVLVSILALGNSSERLGAQESNISGSADLALRYPAWTNDVVYWESSVLLDDEDGTPPKARLARPALEILAIRHADRTTTLDNALRLDPSHPSTLIQQSPSVTAIKKSEFYKSPNAAQSYRHRTGNENEWLLYAPGRWFHDRNIEVTYRAKLIEDAKPIQSVLGYLPRTMQRLLDGEPVQIAISGDSISTGLDASKTANANPHQEGYVELLAQQLRSEFKSEIKVNNRSVPGWSVANGNEDVQNLLASPHDLVIIAYGMNDVGRRDPKWFHDQLHSLIQKTRTLSPDAEIVLVSPMLGNSEWIHTPFEMFEKYSDEMRKLVGPGIAMADVTAVWTWMNQRKHFFDMTGNGLNHPNDFGHRVYAQCILQLLPPPSK